MLEKFIVHIKNIIFFKLIIYLLTIGFLLWLMPILKEDYNKAQQRVDTAEKSFSEAAVKLYSIIESESKILDTYRTYEEILNTPEEHICTLRSLLINKIKNLASEYKAGEANIKFSQIFKSSEQSKSQEVKIKDYNINTKFTAPNIIAFQNMIKQAYMIMPENSIITLAQIEMQEFLDPQLISMLSKDYQPDLLKAELNIRIRELSIK